MPRFIHWNKDYIAVHYSGDNSWCNHDGNSLSFGGSQMWMHDGNVVKWHQHFQKKKVLRDSGCGLISGADILLYLAKKNDAYATPYTNVVLEKGQSIMEYDRYMAYLELMNENFFPINTIFGITGFSIARGINRYSRKHKLGIKARWCASGKKMLSRIEEMLSKDIPITLSIGPMRKNGVMFYDWMPDEKNKYNFETYSHEDYVSGHYVTITGLMCDESGRRMLEISSWGRKYYINFDEFMETVKRHSNFLFSNVLYINLKKNVL